MKREEYKVMHHTIGKYRCVSINSYDKCLSGRRGEIWLASDTICHAFVAYTDHEKIFTFNIKELAKWVKRLEIPSDPQEQLKWANNPNSRF